MLGSVAGSERQFVIFTFYGTGYSQKLRLVARNSKLERLIKASDTDGRTLTPLINIVREQLLRVFNYNFSPPLVYA
jgi:hypothetical protein